MRAILVASLLALASFATLALPSASADTCAAVVLEDLVCTPVNAFYCVFGGVEFHNLGAVPGCEVRVVENCLANCGIVLS
ncbi:MAG: hypothetical protein QOE90_619 [Thermoplasmata archaeon]|jgi:hypothetical protein|nr:hypothetical protein [Thermoplasmata archaeon]